MLAIDHDNEYLVLTREGEDLALVDPAIRTAHNAAICHPTGWSVDEPGHPESMLRRSAEFQDWLVAQRVDLYHATTPFLFIDPFPVDFDACPMVATFYDAIPLIYPQHYLPEPFRDAYSCCLAAVLRADRLQAISASARRDASVYVGFPRNRIDLVDPIADDCFRPLDDRRAWEALATIGERVRIPRQFVLAVSSTHHSKNAETLLRAYALLEERLRTRFPLVFCCHLDEAGRALVLTLAESLGITDDVIVTGMVTDLELAALYNAATVLVHPSRYEGFGLPVLEAMQCGTPVVTTTASSLPEVGGDAAVLVDPEDAVAMADAIAGGSGTPIAGRRWRGPGGNAGRFTGEALEGRRWRATAALSGGAPSRVHRSRSRSRRRPRAGCAWRCGRRCRPNRPAFPITPSSCSPASPATSTSRSSSTGVSSPTST